MLDFVNLNKGDFDLPIHIHLHVLNEEIYGGFG